MQGYGLFFLAHLKVTCKKKWNKNRNEGKRFWDVCGDKFLKQNMAHFLRTDAQLKLSLHDLPI